jgi:hypothetical protein
MQLANLVLRMTAGRKISDHVSGHSRNNIYSNYGSWTCVPDIIPKGISVLHIFQQCPESQNS